ncbi:MAG: peptidylprolyl isomerase [Pseudomonadota bacterium]
MTVLRQLRMIVALLALCMAALAMPRATSAQTMFKPVAIVNDSAITGFDLAQRAQIFTALGAAAPTPDALRTQALNSLIEERLKYQAGEAIGISYSQDAVDLGLEEFASQFEDSPEALRTRLKNQGISDQSINDFVAAEAIWREVVRTRFLRRAEPSEAQIDAEIALSANAQNVSFRLRELALTLTGDQAQDQQIRERIIDLYNQYSTGVGFEEAVSQFSNGRSAANGGELGWVPGRALPGPMVQDLNRLQIGQVTRPVTVQNGVALFQLLERRVESGGDTEAAATPEERERVRRRLVSETITRLADGFLQELRRDALIEVR